MPLSFVPTPSYCPMFASCRSKHKDANSPASRHLPQSAKVRNINYPVFLPVGCVAASWEFAAMLVCKLIMHTCKPPASTCRGYAHASVVTKL